MFLWMGELYLPDQTTAPLIVYNAFLIEEIRVRSTFIYLTAGITAYSSVMKCFMFTSEIVSAGFHTNTSLPLPLSFQPSHNETNRPALSEMHYICAYLSAFTVNHVYLSFGAML